MGHALFTLLGSTYFGWEMLLSYINDFDTEVIGPLSLPIGLYWAVDEQEM